MSANILGPFYENIALAWIIIVLSVIAILSNVLVGCMFICYRHKLLGNVNNMFLLSMTSADLCVGITGLIQWILYLTLAKLTMVWKLCGVLPTFGSFFISIFSLAMMTCDRLISVKYALRYPAIMTERRAKLCITATWLIVFAYLVVQSVVFAYVSPWVELKARSFAVGALFSISSLVLSVSNTILYQLVRKKFSVRKLLSSNTGPDSCVSADPTRASKTEHWSNVNKASTLKNSPQREDNEVICNTSSPFRVAETRRGSRDIQSRRLTNKSWVVDNVQENNHSSAYSKTVSYTEPLNRALSKDNTNSDFRPSTYERNNVDVKNAASDLINDSNQISTLIKSSDETNLRHHENNGFIDKRKISCHLEETRL